jgi:uncharacterized protein (UPF0548 family)
MNEVRFRPLQDPHAKLVDLRRRDLNFDPSTLGAGEPAWRIDEYRQVLPSESPGGPVQGGSWDTARTICAAYGFVDDSLVHAIYDPENALEDRTMLLEVHFWGLLIYAPVRVHEVFEGARAHDDKEARVWGWNYRTLEGHFEMGQIDYEIWKWLETGEVEFRIKAISKAASISNPVLRIGFAVFGRRKQVQFAQQACKRMAILTSEAIGR